MWTPSVFWKQIEWFLRPNCALWCVGTWLFNEALSFKSFIKRGILVVFGWKTINLISRHLNLFTRYSDTTSTPAAVGPRRQPIGGFTFRIKKCDRKSELEHSGLYQFYNVQKCMKTWANHLFFCHYNTNIFSLLCEILHLDEAFGFWGWPIVQRRETSGPRPVCTLQNRRKSPQKISVGMSMPGMVFCSTPLNLSSS